MPENVDHETFVAKYRFYICIELLPIQIRIFF